MKFEDIQDAVNYFVSVAAVQADNKDSNGEIMWHFVDADVVGALYDCGQFTKQLVDAYLNCDYMFDFDNAVDCWIEIREAIAMMKLAS